MTQNQMILKHLRRGRSLTVFSALKLYGIMALSQRCGELRGDGYPIDSSRVTRNGKTFAEYRLKEHV